MASRSQPVPAPSLRAGLLGEIWAGSAATAAGEGTAAAEAADPAQPTDSAAARIASSATGGGAEKSKARNSTACGTPIVRPRDP